MTEKTLAFRLPGEVSRKLATSVPEQLGEILLKEIGARSAERHWVMPDGTHLPEGGPRDFALDLGRIKAIEKAFWFDIQAFSVDSEYGGWDAQVYFPPERTPHGCLYWTDRFDSEEQARAALVITYCRAQRGEIAGVEQD